MKISDYKFEVGDEAITVEGIRARVVNICTCYRCVERGFNELTIQNDYGDVEYVTDYDAESGFKGWYSIGKYRFDEFDRDWVQKDIARYKGKIANLEYRLKLMDEIEAKEKSYENK